MNQDIDLTHESSNKEAITVSVTMLSTESGVHRNEDSEILEKTEKYLHEAVTHDSDFYKITLTVLPPAFICGRDDFNRVYERETEGWLVGANTNIGLLFLDPRLYKNMAEKYGYTPETNKVFSEEYFLRLIKHEVGHVYFQALLSGHTGPFMRWLNEGCQYAAAGQMMPDNALYEQFDPGVFSPPKGTTISYQSSATAVMRLIEVFGQDGFIDRLHILLGRTGQGFSKEKAEDSASPEKVFKESFQELFGFELNKERMEKFVRSGQIPNESDALIK